MRAVGSPEPMYFRLDFDDSETAPDEVKKVLEFIHRRGLGGMDFESLSLGEVRLRVVGDPTISRDGSGVKIEFRAIVMD